MTYSGTRDTMLLQLRSLISKLGKYLTRFYGYFTRSYSQVTTEIRFSEHFRKRDTPGVEPRRPEIRPALALPISLNRLMNTCTLGVP